MALTADEQAFLDFALAALPRWMNATDEFLLGCAKMFGGVKAMIDYWFGQTLIGQAVGPATGTPDWLNQHARDRDTSRQYTETDPALRDRLRNVPEALTRASLLAAVNAILTAESVAGTAAMLELPRDAGYCGTFTSDSGTGGTFAAGASSPLFTFRPTVPFAMPPFRDPSVVRLVQGYEITIAGAAHGANNGTFPITALSNNAVVYSNVSGVAEADAGVTWTTKKLDRRGNVLEGHGKAHCTRGFRTTAVRPNRIIIILPYGSTTGTEASVREMLAQKKAAGFAVTIERRLNP